jgi:uncharacterized protein (DUF983 family)
MNEEQKTLKSTYVNEMLILRRKICGDVLVVLEILIIGVIIVISTVLIHMNARMNIMAIMIVTMMIIGTIIGGKPTLKHEFNSENWRNYEY